MQANISTLTNLQAINDNRTGAVSDVTVFNEIKRDWIETAKSTKIEKKKTYYDIAVLRLLDDNTIDSSATENWHTDDYNEALDFAKKTESPLTIVLIFEYKNGKQSQIYESEYKQDVTRKSI
ncbi:MAG: hypothetical protein LBN39_07555 [Planctomycetaceae bacterium]|jgi:hypothetical protein|nr:hypothetical protein [Planctomycetaceae bacterium]